MHELVAITPTSSQDDYPSNSNPRPNETRSSSPDPESNCSHVVDSGDFI
jgi:hypothetical protein